MNFPSLLADHEQRAFSEFLNQLAQEDNPSGTKTDGANGTGAGPGTAGVDPSLTQQQQQQLQLQLQHHLHLRQLQQQHQQQQQAQNGVAGLNRVPLPSMMPPPSLPMDAQQLAFAQQQRDWIQQISSNPLLAPGGVINPHAMSQAMLQNPLLMAQANAISQAMVLAQQQQQLQLQLQQQQHQQQQQHFQQTQQHQQHQPDNNNPAHSMHPPIQQQALSFQQQSNNSMLPPFHAQSLSSSQQQQYPGQQLQHQDREPLSPTSESGAASLAQMSSGKLRTKRKSNTDSSHMNTNVDNTRGSSSSRSSSPFPLAPNGQHSPSETAGTDGNVNQLQKQESDVENGTTAQPQRKTARRKGSTAKSMSMDSSSSSLVAKSSHRTSRDGFDPLQGNARRKTKGDSSTKNGSSPSQQQQQQNSNGDAHDMNMIKEKSEEAEFKQERSSPSRQQKDSTLSPTPSQSSLSAGQPRSKKPHHELLTEAEKKANHIASEQKRRQNIRVGFDSLVEIVPTLSDCHRSEAVILQKSVDYIQRLLGQKNELKGRVRELQTHLGDPLDDVDSGSDMDIEPSE
ncbi:hypothetical protein BG011_000579 [Mortierella polycephala]|uniref:BHLH domain-containing protein n=1 Tax=Mortierella polycephala TaxID=41804 RepID=A0A9P6U6X1_9FUNG|nr:hypothetical protein BG011_000579 [Mortierella polycephala]